MSRFAGGVQMANVEQMTLPELDQAKTDVLAALDGADNPNGAKADNSGFNETIGVLTGASMFVMALQAVAAIGQAPQPQQQQQQASQSRDFLTGKKKAPTSTFIGQAHVNTLAQRAQPAVRAAVQSQQLMQGKPARAGSIFATRGRGIDLIERANIASGSTKSKVKGAKVSPEVAQRLLPDALKIQLGVILRAENNLSLNALASAPDDARAKRSMERLSGEQQSKMMRSQPALKAVVAPPKPPAPSATA